MVPGKDCHLDSSHSSMKSSKTNFYLLILHTKDRVKVVKVNKLDFRKILRMVAHLVAFLPIANFSIAWVSAYVKYVYFTQVQPIYS